MVKKTSLGFFGLMMLMITVAVLPALGFVEKGNKLGDLEFSAPLDAEAASYLGVPADKPFKLSQVKAPFVLMEVFATGCSHCVTHAPVMNQLFAVVAKDKDAASKVKLIGLGSTDNASNLMAWKGQFKVPFALVPDPDSKTTDKINIMGTPTTILLNNKGDVLLARPGGFPNADDFLKEIKGLMK